MQRGFEIFAVNLQKFKSISLDELENKELLGRYDTKFVINQEIFGKIIDIFSNFYNILEINNQRIFHYENLYFDTPLYDLFNDHINGKLNRFKVRYRKYLEKGDCYFEIKKRNNKRFTQKYRRKSIFSFIIEKSEQEFLQKYLKIDHPNFLPKLFVSYQRITLLHKTKSEKITFDTDIYFRNTHSELQLPELVIGEIKSNKSSYRSEVFDILKSKQVHPVRISKYCTGTILTNHQLKYNRYKPKLKLIDKLCGIIDGQHSF